MITQSLKTTTHDQSYKDFVKFLNDLRCPLCDNQLDGNIHPTCASLYCVANNQEYQCIWEPNAIEPSFEGIFYTFDGQYSYGIFSSFEAAKGGIKMIRTTITQYNNDNAPELKFKYSKNVFELVGFKRILFFRKKLSEKEFNEKLKLYNVFS